MPSHVYFEALTAAVLTDADEAKGFLRQQSPEERQALAERMHDRIVETFTKLLEVELEQVGQLEAWQEKIEGVRRATQEEAGETNVVRAREVVETFAHQVIPDYDAFLLKAGLRIRKAFVGTLTK